MKNITDSSDNGKKACFSSADTVGNVSYRASAALAVSGDEPARVWNITAGSSVNNAAINITHDFDAAIYSDSSCTTALTATTADNLVKLGTTDGDNDVAATVTYDAANYTITIDPDSDLSDDTYYASVSDAWYYQDGACSGGSAAKLRFVVDTVAPSVSDIEYENAADGTGSAVVNAPLTGSFYTIVSFSENIAQTVGDGAAARPAIWYKTGATRPKCSTTSSRPARSRAGTVRRSRGRACTRVSTPAPDSPALTCLNRM